MGRKDGLSVVVAGMAALPASARRAALYQKAVRLALGTSKAAAGLRGEVNVVFLGRAAMLKMNRRYLRHDEHTDVITFPHDVPRAIGGDDRPIGDIFISAWMARRQAKELGHSVAIEAATLAAHGALHLLGHDDHRPAARTRMFKIQDRVVAFLRRSALILAPLALLSSLASAPARAAARPTLSIEARAFKPGELILVTVAGNDAKIPPEASLRGQPLVFFPGASMGTWLAFAGLDLDVSTGPATLSAVMRAPSGKLIRKAETFNIVGAGFPIVELQVDRKFVTPDKNDAERAEAEAAKLHKLFAKTEEKRLFEGRFDSPIPGAATARFGERRVFNGQPRAPHSGMDLKALRGRPVRAPAAGKVLLADPLFFAGKTIILDHGLGLTTQYAHLAKFLVKPGDRVKKGQIIGQVGATGRVTGPHLHWALKLRNARIDPYSLVFLDLDAKLKTHPDDPLMRSAFCGATDIPAPAAWSKASGGLRARARATKAAYAPGERVSFLIEIQNIGRKPAFIDFVRDAAMRPLVLGIGEDPRPYDALASPRDASRPLTDQIEIPKGKTLCFEQNQNAAGPLLALKTASYTLSYGTEYLYASTATVRAGLWRGRLAIPSATVVVSTTP